MHGTSDLTKRLMETQSKLEVASDKAERLPLALAEVDRLETRAQRAESRCQALLNAKAELDAMDENSNTPLHLALNGEVPRVVYHILYVNAYT